MKAININGNIKVYKNLPKSYGSVIGGFDLLSDSELAEQGFYNVIVPSYNKAQELGDIYFDSDNNQFTYPVNNKTFAKTLDELKQDKIYNLKNIYNEKLSQTDWIIIRDKELGNNTTQSVLDDRAALRTACGNHETAINAKTTKQDVVLYNLPSLD